jgi:hypothetical protein
VNSLQSVVLTLSVSYAVIGALLLIILSRNRPTAPAGVEGAG